MKSLSAVFPSVLKDAHTILSSLKKAPFSHLGLTEPDPRRVAAAYSFVLQKAYKEYTGMKVSGASAMLQLPGSDITIHIPDGVHGVLVAHAHTDFQPFREIVPERECFISPVAEVQYIPRDKNEKPKKFMICIPHNVEDKDAWANIQVRRVDIYRFVLIVHHHS